MIFQLSHLPFGGGIPCRSVAQMQPDIVSFSAAISACEKARTKEWRKAMFLLDAVLKATLLPDSWPKNWGGGADTRKS